VQFSGSEWFALAISASFAAGLNVYATVATMGLLAHAGVLSLPSSLHALENWWVIAAAGALYALEFVADKIPVFDLIWNALHTFVRIPVAALIAYGATQQLSPQAQLLSALLGGSIALVAHSGKMAARSAVTPSPEPISNAALSLTEDGAAIGLTWFASHHPYIAASVTAGAVVALVFAVHWLIRAMKRLFRGAARAVRTETAA
jgi:Domain of unknown function (DUF4126)